jgi:hypothetical protein
MVQHGFRLAPDLPGDPLQIIPEESRGHRVNLLGRSALKVNG